MERRPSNSQAAMALQLVRVQDCHLSPKVLLRHAFADDIDALTPDFDLRMLIILHTGHHDFCFFEIDHEPELGRAFGKVPEHLLNISTLLRK